MTNRPKGYGLSADIQRKIMEKYDPQLEADVIMWINAILGDGTMQGAEGPTKVREVLKDGQILCKLINAIQPGSVKKIHTGKLAAHQMENISNFLTGCENYGCKRNDLFQTAALYDGTNMVAVIDGICALGRKCQTQGYDGPTLGPKEADAAPREFTEEQKKAGAAIIGLQAGTNKGASQAGMNFGKSRMIID